MLRFLALLLALLLASPGLAQSVVQTDNVRAELVSDVATVKPGEPFWVGLRQTIRPKWHTYWKNPGESGLPTEIAWTLPAGAKADPIVWPTPSLFDIGGVTNYGFKDEAMLLVRITPPADLAGPLKLAATANWLVCEDICIPEDGKFELTLPSGTAATPAPPAVRALFEQARRNVPLESPWPARYGVSKAGDPTLIVEAMGLKADTIRDVYFFPAEWGPVATMARQTASITADGIRIPLRKGDATAAMPAVLAGTLVLTEKTADSTVKQAFDVSARLDPAFVPASSLAGAVGAEQLSLVQALLFALLGGLILNLMPCVFPVLAMKAAAFARLAGHERSDMRRDGLAYTAGVLVAFAAMAAVVVAIRASVGDVTWGFQFQTPVFSLLIAYLFFVVGLNLSGAFEFGGRLAGVGHGLAARSGTTGAFFTGVLAVIVATPCTAPFMAAALGFALSQPAPVTVAVLLAMGLGLALPYLALTMIPALQRMLPRPGPWMDRLRQFLAFPMYASAVWMIWVLTQQTGSDGVLYALGGMILIAFAIWLLRLGSGSSPAVWLRRGVAAAAVLLAFAAALRIEDSPATAASASGSPASGVNFEGWERFSRDRMNVAHAAGKPVFVDFTAAWCITCLVNERVALETPATKKAFEQAGVVKLKGDWTNRDDEITGVLKELGRAGVPLYLFWAPDAGAPKILPQVLTEAMILSELSSIQQAKR
ncbi:protein-disulfide reductase DsbD [Reyranella sp.]|uniref:protein-disulfide reductase DsbD family protein n=1 Tax=Reyranella sp. TaxID=1929291 RepID=UPI00272F3CA2|nr:protein-disulfide reductase DsbD domain-containing protein [Reyranella sp.]MDP2374066.1 protein-disulfide reductase DsbD family protein [Reyranella sp.]